MEVKQTLTTIKKFKGRLVLNNAVDFFALLGSSYTLHCTLFCFFNLKNEINLFVCSIRKCMLKTHKKY